MACFSTKYACSIHPRYPTVALQVFARYCAPWVYHFIFKPKTSSAAACTHLHASARADGFALTGQFQALLALDGFECLGSAEDLAQEIFLQEWHQPACCLMSGNAGSEEIGFDRFSFQH